MILKYWVDSVQINNNTQKSSLNEAVVLSDEIWVKVLKKVKPFFKAVGSDCRPGFFVKGFPSVFRIENGSWDEVDLLVDNQVLALDYILSRACFFTLVDTIPVDETSNGVRAVRTRHVPGSHAFILFILVSDFGKSSPIIRV